MVFREKRATFPPKTNRARGDQSGEREVLLILKIDQCIDFERSNVNFFFLGPPSCICSPVDVIHDVQNNKRISSANLGWCAIDGCSIYSSLQIGTYWRNSITCVCVCVCHSVAIISLNSNTYFILLLYRMYYKIFPYIYLYIDSPLMGSVNLFNFAWRQITFSLTTSIFVSRISLSVCLSVSVGTSYLIASKTKYTFPCGLVSFIA